MSESRSHIELVKVAYRYITNLVPEEKHCLIQIDSADSMRPKEVRGGFIPDVQFWDENLYIIGEAKTLNDFEREHSREQYNAYIDECKDFKGKSILVVAVPWQLVITAKNYFRRQKCVNENFRIVILNELGGNFEV